MPLWSTRSAIWRALSASYAFSGSSRGTRYIPAPGWGAQTRALLKARARQVCGQPLPATLEARIAARVSREKANGTYDYVEPAKVRLPKRAAVKRNGGLRGSTATRWRR